MTFMQIGNKTLMTWWIILDFQLIAKIKVNFLRWNRKPFKTETLSASYTPLTLSTFQVNSFERQIRDQRSYAFVSLVYANCDLQRNRSRRKIKSRKKFLSFMSSLPTFEAGQKILRTWSDSAYEDHWNANASDYFSWSSKHRRMAKRLSHFSAIKWILMSPRYSCRSASSKPRMRQRSLFKYYYV